MRRHEPHAHALHQRLPRNQTDTRKSSFALGDRLVLLHKDPGRQVL